jgi:cytochrome d ubiquinol oxidase subunit II
MAIDLPLIWAAIVGLAVAMYVILDGFDLGIGVLLGFTHQPGERDQMVNAIVPFWDGGRQLSLMRTCCDKSA